MDGHREPREVSGLTTGLIISYVEKTGGREAVHAVLAKAGLSGFEQELRDEQTWVADSRRVDLFKAASEVLGDPRVATSIGRSALEHNVGLGLKLSLRALGSPRLVYANIARANSKFTAAYEMTVDRVENESATMLNVRKIPGEGDPSDCDYNVGLLATVPELFGLPAAEVWHPECVHRGAEECRYEVAWQQRSFALAWAIGGVGTLLAAGALAPALLPLAAVAAALMLAVAGRGMLGRRRNQIDHLRNRVNQEMESAALMMASLRELVAELRVDDVLEEITRRADAAVGGAEFALIVRSGDRMECRRATGPLRGRTEALERWVAGLGTEPARSITVDDLREIDELAPVADDRRDPFRSMCAAPLRFKGETFGFLVAMFTGVHGALPRDIIQLDSYATLAAIALKNAQLYSEQERLATRDPLTGLLNHRQYHETLEAELARARRSGERFGLALFDLDGFKQINDSYGHARGDQVLRSVGEALSGAGRVSDQAFRIGGDEFAMILPATGLEQARLVAERAALEIGKADRKAAASWGVASWPETGEHKEALIESADAALYRMKRASATSLAVPLDQ